MIHVWAKAHPFGTELAEITIADGRLEAVGTAIGTEPTPYRLDYRLSTTSEYATERLVVRAGGEGWHRALDLKRASSGEWSCTAESAGAPDLALAGGDLSLLAGALDCDLALSPMTNSMPVLRHRLHEQGGPFDFLMAWVSVPDLTVSPSRQRYRFIRHDGGAHLVRFQDLDSTFRATIRFDDEGIVLDYPGIARRVA